MSDDTVYNVTADELSQFVEQLEQMNVEKTELGDRVKELMAEASAKGYDKKIIRKIVALRKKTADAIKEENDILEVYMNALGMLD